MILGQFYYNWDYWTASIITNRRTTVKNILHFHNWRGYQENIFSKLKSQCQLEYIPFKRKIPNIKDRNTTAKRKPLWIFSEANTIRQKIIHLAGRLTRPGGKLTLTMNGNSVVENDFKEVCEALAA